MSLHQTTQIDTEAIAERLHVAAETFDGLNASYEDMTPGGMPSTPSLEFSNVDTLIAVACALDAANEQRDVYERQEGIANDLWHRVGEYYGQTPAAKPFETHEEEARQVRRTIREIAHDQIQGVDKSIVEKMKFLDIIMNNQNQHPDIPDGQRFNPQAKAEENRYAT